MRFHFPIRIRRRVPVPVRSALICALLVLTARADDAPDVARLRQELQSEKRARAADRDEFERRLRALESQRGSVLRDEIESYLEERELFEPEPEDATIAAAGSLIDISVILDATVGGADQPDAVLQAISLGDHDPRVRGFNARNEEFVVSADVDPWFYGLLDVVFKIDEEGESTFELEEAYALSTSLPAGLQLKVGQFFTEFGRANPTHPHTWEFVNFPVILGRVFGGDGWRGQGVRVSWLVPASFPLTVLVGAQNARGETQASFLGEEGEEVGDHVLMERGVHGLADLAYHVRVETSRDFASPDATTTALLGASFAAGPNATGPDADTRIYGVDLFLKWRPHATDAGWPFVKWQTEFVYRDYGAAAQTREVDDGMGGVTIVAVDAATYTDWGFYTEIVWAFRRPWTAGIRYDYADSDAAWKATHHRVSAALTYYTSEFARIRLQLNWDRVADLATLVPGAGDDVLSVWINFNFSLGKHGAHKF